MREAAAPGVYRRKLATYTAYVYIDCPGMSYLGFLAREEAHIRHIR